MVKFTQLLLVNILFASEAAFIMCTVGGRRGVFLEGQFFKHPPDHTEVLEYPPPPRS